MGATMRVETMSDIQRAAVYLTTVSEELKSLFFRSIPPRQVAEVKKEISALGEVDPALRRDVNEYFKRKAAIARQGIRPIFQTEAADKPHKVSLERFLTYGCMISIILMTVMGLAFSGYVILSETMDPELKSYAFGIIGVIIGFWFRLPFKIMGKK